jgi:hypothetical protein
LETDSEKRWAKETAKHSESAKEKDLGKALARTLRLKRL